MRQSALSLTLVAWFVTVIGPAAAQKTPPIPDDVLFEPDIEYANPDGQHLQLDLARPKSGSGPFPAVISLHGGGFRGGSRKSNDAFCMRLAQQGYVAMTVSYRVAPKYQFPAAVHDVKEAVRWARANARKYHIDPEHVGATGTSAGGHLAQFLGVTSDVKQFEGTGANLEQSSRVACVVNFFGPCDFTRFYGLNMAGDKAISMWLGGNLESARARHIQASPLSWVTPNAAPTLCIHGTKDGSVAHEQSVWLIERLQADGVEAELLTMEGAGHGFNGADAQKAEKALLAFFAKHLKKK